MRREFDRLTIRIGVITPHQVDASLVGETVALRYDPSRPGSPIQVVFKNRSYSGVKPVDAYANSFVRRDHGSKLLEPSTPPDTPRPGLRLRELKDL